jgi:hypothetical protein
VKADEWLHGDVHRPRESSQARSQAKSMLVCMDEPEEDA